MAKSKTIKELNLGYKANHKPLLIKKGKLKGFLKKER